MYVGEFLIVVVCEVVECVIVWEGVWVVDFSLFGLVVEVFGVCLVLEWCVEFL